MKDTSSKVHEQMHRPERHRTADPSQPDCVAVKSELYENQICGLLSSNGAYCSLGIWGSVREAIAAENQKSRRRVTEELKNWWRLNRWPGAVIRSM
nr:hypothetical protein Iba_chr02cCG13230 [Ipomoea batatas]GMC65270.1 hypothetical protein Iba_chr02dCG12610 [Ipomoea batatas]GMD99178.1 hypothetical protein Iba_scaffold55329CG0020 [Ipomoea batatas]GME03358.1 hypothetical protein Iba_scaffold686CG0010 [Ipomoea batatas]